MALHKYGVSENHIYLEFVPMGSLFVYNDRLYLKTKGETEEGAIEAYEIGTGDFFWGHAQTAEQQRKIRVFPIKLLKNEL